MRQFRLCIPWIHIGPQKKICRSPALAISSTRPDTYTKYTTAQDINKPYYYDSLSSTVYPAGAKINTTKEEALG
jgi:hypothetical protein